MDVDGDGNEPLTVDVTPSKDARQTARGKENFAPGGAGAGSGALGASGVGIVPSSAVAQGSDGGEAAAGDDAADGAAPVETAATKTTAAAPGRGASHKKQKNAGRGGRAAAAAAAAAARASEKEEKKKEKEREKAEEKAAADALIEKLEHTYTTEEGETQTVMLPLDVGMRLMCSWRDGKWYQAKIIERRKPSTGQSSADYEYYVHYEQFNRRLDNWVQLADMKLETLGTDDGGNEKDAGGRTRGQKRKAEDADHDPEHAEFDPHQLREHEEYTKVRNILSIELGKYEMETWYFSPFPAEYNDCEKLYFCEFTLNFFRNRNQLIRHLRKNEMLHPPGDEIYRNGRVSMFEVDGRREKIFCQNLCYLAKLFLDHKTLYYDVDLFLFYVLCECDERGCHIVGYFSKERRSEEGYNLACILTLPSYQRKGYGKFLISFSYELSKKENKVGTPERPLSDLGQVSYRSYWTRVILNVLKEYKGSVSIKELSEMTAIKTDDIISVLNYLQLIQYQKGQHVICAVPKLIDKYLAEAGSEGVRVDPEKLYWTPPNQP